MREVDRLDCRFPWVGEAISRAGQVIGVHGVF